MPDLLVVAAVVLGSAVLAGALVHTLRHLTAIPRPLRRRWLALGTLMAFFLVGYLAFLATRLWAVAVPVERLVAAIFLGGACFVWLVIHLCLQALTRLELRRRELEERNRELAAEVDRRREAEERAATRLHYLSALHAIDTVISASLDLRVTLKVFLDQVVSHLAIDGAAVLLLDRHTQTLEFAAGTGFTTHAMEETRLRLGQGHAGRAALERRIAVVPDLAKEDESRLDLLRREGFTSYCAQPLVAKGEVRGVLEIFHRHPFTPDPDWAEYLESLAVRAAIAIDNATLFNELQRAHAELVIAYDTTIEGWGRALELRDRETAGHTGRVAAMTVAMARAFGISEDKLVHISRGALLHDIGKMAIPDAILMKDGPLTAEERAIMEEHPTHAFRMLAPIPYLQPALDIPYCHHERWDGTGYPRGLKGEQIPLAARIFAVADTYDALVNERRYHKPWPPAEACRHIADQAGSHFDPAVVERFLAMDWCTEKQTETAA